VGYALDTWGKWGLLVSVCIIDTFIGVWACDTVYPWTSFNVFDRKNKEIEYSWWQTFFIIQAMNTYQNLRPMVVVYLSFTQVDILAIRGITEIVCAGLTSTNYMRDKKYNCRVSESDEYTLVCQ